MGRRLLAFGLSVAVQLATVHAPFVHVHPDDHETDHHRAHEVHAHLSGHLSSSQPFDRPSMDDDQDRAVFLQVFTGVVSTSFHVPPAVAESIELATQAERRTQQALHVAHGLDPPALDLLPSRAPPTFLS